MWTRTPCLIWREPCHLWVMMSPYRILTSTLLFRTITISSWPKRKHVRIGSIKWGTVPSPSRRETYDRQIIRQSWGTIVTHVTTYAPPCSHYFPRCPLHHSSNPPHLKSPSGNRPSVSRVSSLQSLGREVAPAPLGASASGMICVCGNVNICENIRHISSVVKSMMAAT